MTFANKHIGYYLWHYPVLSQTFIRREIAELRRLGCRISIFADASEDILEPFDAATEDVSYLNPIDAQTRAHYLGYFFRKHPARFIASFLYILCRRYEHSKNLRRDLRFFDKAIYLAGLLEENQISHLHSPWADKCAFLCLIVSRLAGITYSVQARASEIHRNNLTYMLREKFEHAAFVVTNSRFNEEYIRSIIHKRSWSKIHVVYNGINPDTFKPTIIRRSEGGAFRILVVARLIEAKGLDYLLKACKILKDKGRAFRCEIIGAPDRTLYKGYYESLMALHAGLSLHDHVFFLGRQPFDVVMQKYADADLFLLPCVKAQDGTQDITPNSIIEAMAMRLPVISTRRTAIPEIIDDGVDGVLVAPNDERALAGAIDTLLGDGDMRTKLGDNARKKIERKFDVRANARIMAGLFESSGCGNILQSKFQPISFSALWIDRKGVLWAISGSTLKRSIGAGRKFKEYDNVTAAGSLSGRMVFEDSRGFLYWNQWGSGFIRRSIDRGLRWHNVCQFCPDESGIWGICEDLAGNLFAGVYTAGESVQDKILRSQDEGLTWHEVYDASERHIHAVACDPYTGYLYATTGDREGLILLSVDHGARWEVISSGKQCVAINFLPGRRLFGDDANGTIYTTSDDSRFSPVYTPRDMLSNFCAARFEGTVIFGQVAHVDGAAPQIVSSDDGVSWDVIWRGEPTKQWNGPVHMSNADRRGNIFVYAAGFGNLKLSLRNSI